MCLRVLAVLGWIVLGSEPAFPQCSEVQFQGGNFVCSPPGTPDTYSAIVSGDLNGDFSPEVAVIKGTSLIIFQDPDAWSDAVVLTDDALDVCYSPDAEGPGNAGLLFTSSQGLQRVTYDGTDYKYRLIDPSPLWRDATKIRWGQGLIGVESNQRTFISAPPQGDGFKSPKELFTLSFAVSDVVLLNWDGDEKGTLEIGILHSHGVHVRDLGGHFLLARSAIVPGDAIAVVHKQDLSDSLAWVTRFDPAGPSYLLLFNQSFGSGYQGPDLLGPMTYGSAATGDLDADGDDDLVLGPVSGTSLQAYENISELDPDPAPPFSLGALTPMDMSVGDEDIPGADTSVGKALCADLFNDRNGVGLPLPGFAVMLPDSDGLRLRPNPHAGPHVGDPADFMVVTYQSARKASNCPSTDPQSPGHWSITLGAGWGTTPNANRIEMIVRRYQPLVGHTDQVAYHHKLFPLTGQVQDKVIDFATQSTSEVDSTIDPLENSPTSYFVMARPVQVNANNTVIQAWRWSILGMSANCNSISWLRGLSGAGPLEVGICNRDTCIDYHFVCDVGFSSCPASNQAPSLGSRYIPSAVPESRIPSSGPGVLPIVRPPDY